MNNKKEEDNRIFRACICYRTPCFSVSYRWPDLFWSRYHPGDHLGPQYFRLDVSCCV